LIGFLTEIKNDKHFNTIYLSTKIFFKSID